jgi:hypothetical protein
MDPVPPCGSAAMVDRAVRRDTPGFQPVVSRACR